MKLTLIIYLLTLLTLAGCANSNICADYSYIKGNRSQSFVKIELKLDSTNTYEYSRKTGSQEFKGSLHHSQGTWKRKMNKVYLYETDGSCFSNHEHSYKIKDGELCDSYGGFKRCRSIE
ncbi:MAG: hypothetical protein ACI837_002401 [Crocinitomicaceae bacterium]|jgi:hypothetical protein